jgi:hypothetical protein
MVKHPSLNQDGLYRNLVQRQMITATVGDEEAEKIELQSTVPGDEAEMQDETGTTTDGGGGSVVADAAGPSAGRMSRRKSTTGNRIIGTGGMSISPRTMVRFLWGLIFFIILIEYWQRESFFCK